jgi:superfamily II DNA/RNA helicase
VTPAATTVERITQRIIQVDHSNKPAFLAQLLKEEQVGRALIFTRTKHGADKVVKGLARAGITADAIHGNKSQNHRERVLAAFRTGEIRTLVATDIAARGIDVDGISHVVNYDLPNIPESYVHRIGRTARAGAAGVAISLCEGEEAAFLRDIEKLIRMSIPATDRRSSPRPHPQPAAQSRDVRPSGRAPGKQRQRHRSGAQRNGAAERNGAQRKQERHAQPQERQAQPRVRQARSQEPQDRIAAVAFLQRGGRPGRNNDQRSPR